jgi:hypothetical protein
MKECNAKNREFLLPVQNRCNRSATMPAAGGKKSPPGVLGRGGLFLNVPPRLLSQVLYDRLVGESLPIVFGGGNGVAFTYRRGKRALSDISTLTETTPGNL